MMDTVHETNAYTGVDNLEVLTEAVNYNAYLFSLITKNVPSYAKVLDFGAGRGDFAFKVQGGSRPVLCVEPDPFLSTQLQARGLNTIDSLAHVEDNSIDFIYSFNVLEHIKDHQATLAEMYRVLKPGGQLLLYVPAFQCLYSAMDAKVGHHRRYTQVTLRPLLLEQGFTITQSRYADAGGFFASLVYKWIGNKSGDINTSSVRFYDRYLFGLSRKMDKLGCQHCFGKNLMMLSQKDGA